MNTQDQTNTQEFTGGRTFTESQLAIVKSYEATHGIEADQISFDGDGLNPSFDHNAISVLSLKLTDIRDISPTQVINDDLGSTVYSKGTLADGRSRGAFGSCRIGEQLANGSIVESTPVAEGVALSRSFRQCIRNLGVDLHRAHQRFVATGEIASPDTLQHPRAAAYREIHRHADELDYIVDGDDAVFRGYLGGLFNGRTSKEELNDLELHQLLVNLRTNVEMKRRGHQAVA